ncbi:MAG TPA: hypothetical protein VFS09_12800, partial [Candidatus Eisenbacteria bacterium]|nr:hypothetical protein [Candidatus Eisenbacteria bacterium]
MRPLALALLLAFVPAVSLATPPDRTQSRFQDQYPAPGAKYVSPETGIMLRPGGAVDLGGMPSEDILDVRGSLSGAHRGRLVVAEDGETILFEPDASFLPGEVVQVRLRPGLRTSLGDVPASRFSFTISRGRGVEPRSGFWGLEEVLAATEAPTAAEPPMAAMAPSAAHDSLPADFPTLTRTVTGTASPGRLFLCNFVFSGPIAPYLLVVDDDGTPVFQRRLQGRALDFKLQPDGRATYFDSSTGKFYA